MEGIEWTKIKYTHSGHTPLNINLNINNKNQDCKTGTVCEERILEGGGRLKEED
jgi:hypothetical protein